MTRPTTRSGVKPRETFSRRSVFVFAAIGSAVGLGNIWRFPFVAYDNGGGAFLLPYLVALLTAVNGVAEECFHRGAVYSAVANLRPILTTTVIYATVTATAGIPLLVLAAVILGLVTAVQRRATGGVLGPAITHVAWSMVMLFALGPILDAAPV